MPEPYATCQSSDRRAGLSGGRHISNQDASMLRYLSEVVEGVEMPTRPLCACRCGCRRRPRRRIQCPREGCSRRWVGPGCHPTLCWNPRTNCARRETRRNQSAKLRVGRWSPWMSSGKDFPSIALPPGAPRWVQRQRQWTQRKPGGLTMPPRTSGASRSRREPARSTRNDGRGRVQ